MSAANEKSAVSVPTKIISPNFARMPAELKSSENWVIWEQLHNQAEHERE